MSGSGIEGLQLLRLARYVITNEPEEGVLCVNDGSQKNNKLAFEESVRAMMLLYDGRWHGKQEVVVDDTTSLTMAVSSGMRLSVGKFQ